MLHKEVALTDATTTDAGEFTAIAATWGIDRQGEAIRQGAFAQTIKNWQGSRKSVPVHWDHRGEAENVIGSIDPSGMIETDEGLHVEGRLDLKTSEVAREAWRSMKNGTISLSFGYLVTDDRDREDGVRELLGIDLFEVTLTPSPANPETRITSMKSERDGVLADAYWRAFKETEAKADAAHEKARRDRELEESIAEIEAKAARDEKRNRPIQVKTFEV